MTERLRRDEAAAYLAATVILAALVHFIVVLLAPYMASRDAFARLAPLGSLDETVLLPRTGPAEKTFPYADPAVAMAFCRYDLALGPIRVQAPAGRSFSSIAFHTRRGVVFYALTDKAATHGVVDAVLGTPLEVHALAAHDDEESPSHDLRVAAPAREGYVVIRVFSELPSLYPEAETEAKRLTCKPEPVPP
jgi:uncharacterized membrane protein